MLNIEHALDAVMLYHRQVFGPRLDAVLARAADPVPCVGVPAHGSHYIGDWTMYRSLMLPAVFFTVPRSRFVGGENLDIWDHALLVSYLLEGVEEDVLTRGCWRMAEAGYDALHDQDPGASFSLIMQFKEASYGPTLVRTRGERAFRKDVTLVFNLRHKEQFTPLG